MKIDIDDSSFSIPLDSIDSVGIHNDLFGDLKHRIGEVAKQSLEASIKAIDCISNVNVKSIAKAGCGVAAVMLALSITGCGESDSFDTPNMNGQMDLKEIEYKDKKECLEDWGNHDEFCNLKSSTGNYVSPVHDAGGTIYKTNDSGSFIPWFISANPYNAFNTSQRVSSGIPHSAPTVHRFSAPVQSIHSMPVSRGG
ncbi:MAG TPA: hypothetical protein VIY47_00765, partial [Ignavibacteriaceae bacterium]